MPVHVVRDSVCDDLFRGFQSNLDFYRKGGEWSFDEDQLLPAALEVRGEPPSLLLPGARRTLQKKS